MSLAITCAPASSAGSVATPNAAPISSTGRLHFAAYAMNSLLRSFGSSEVRPWPLSVTVELNAMKSTMPMKTALVGSCAASIVPELA